MNRIKEQIKDIATRYTLQIIYAFGSRAKESFDLVENRSIAFISCEWLRISFPMCG